MKKTKYLCNYRNCKLPAENKTSLNNGKYCDKHLKLIMKKFPDLKYKKITHSKIFMELLNKFNLQGNVDIEIVKKEVKK